MTKPPGHASGADAVRDARRYALIEDIENEFALTADMTGLAAMDPRVRTSMETVPRDAFVPHEEREYAWLNQPLPIGYRQTISQPFIVALMTSLLEPQPSDRILEVGTGSGYQAAVLSGLVDHIWSIELVPELAKSATDRLKAMGYDNVSVRAGDGAAGWPEHAPFDGIVVTAGAPVVPPALIEQLAEGGRMVIPVDAALGQALMLIEKLAGGELRSRKVLPVRFVPLRAAPDGP